MSRNCKKLRTDPEFGVVFSLRQCSSIAGATPKAGKLQAFAVTKCGRRRLLTSRAVFQVTFFRLNKVIYRNFSPNPGGTNLNHLQPLWGFYRKGMSLLSSNAELDALLELKRYDLKRMINRLHSPIVRHLPPDVTSIIFEFCLPDFTDHQLYPSSKEEHSIPLALGAICSYWREIAWSTPRLWSSLVVRVPRKHDSHIATGIAQEWLARSGQLPLSIRIVSTSYNDAISALADIINQYSTRWSHLDFYMPLQYYQHFHANDNHAPILKSIRFYGAECATDLNFQLTCPRLDRASLSYFHVQGTNIQWDNLIHLTLHSMSINDSFLILHKTPRLVFCKVSGYCEPYKGPSLGALVLTSLKSLQLLIVNFAEDFLKYLIAPHLEEFSLPNYYNPSTGVITSFLQRSACSLLSLSMIFSTFPPYFEGFMDLLQSIPSLNKLSIRSITTTTRDFEDITPEDYDPRNILQLVAKVLSSQSTSLQQGFLPNLKIMEYTGMLNHRPGKYDDLYSLLPTGDAVHGPLHLVKLDIYPETRMSKNMVSYLSSLVERGITVNVLSRSKDIFQSSIDFYSRDWTDNFDSSLFS